MTLNFMQISDMLKAFEELKEVKMPFKLSLILAKNTSMLQNEYDFYIEREREFAMKYLEVDPETQQFKQFSDGLFQIKEGLQEECREARKELNDFTVDINLRTIPMNLVENMDFTPAQIAGIEMLIEEEE
jgi:hypothetical protein